MLARKMDFWTISSYENIEIAMACEILNCDESWENFNHTQTYQHKVLELDAFRFYTNIKLYFHNTLRLNWLFCNIWCGLKIIVGDKY